MSIMDIVAIGNKNWLKTADGTWHHLAVDKNGDTYFNGKLIPPITWVEPEVEIHDPVKRWEILDFST
jgi:hypothetical protein